MNRSRGSIPAAGAVVLVLAAARDGTGAVVGFVPGRPVGFALIGNTSPNEMTAIGKAGRLLWPLLLGENEPPAKAAATGTTARQPDAKAAPNSSPAQDLPSIDELLARMIAAHGGERNIRRHPRMTVHARKLYANQGVEAELAVFSSAPSSRSEEEAWTAAGKSIGRVRTFYDGSRGGQETTFGQDEIFAGDELDKARRKSARHPILDAHTLYSQVTLDRKETSDGEDVFFVKLVRKSGPAVSLYVSARTSLIVKEETDGESTTFGAYRFIDGEIVPFRSTIHDSLGESTIEIRDVSFDAEISPAKFQPSK